MNTNIVKTDKTLLTSIAPGQYNSTVSSLILFGKNFANYGTAMNENLIHLMENFAYSQPPRSPIQGQLWYNTTDKQTYQWDGVKWKLLNAESLRSIADAIVKNRLYVSKSGDDNNSGLSWYSAKLTIKAAAVEAAKLLATGVFDPDHVAILVASGDYEEICPIELPPGVSLIGDNLRAVTVRPQVATTDVFYLNSKCYVFGITVRGHQLSPSALDITPTGYAEASGANLPRNTQQKGFAFGFAPGANILVSPYIQNCSSISGDPDTGSGVTPGGGGVLIDPTVLGPDNRIHSIVVDAFTQVNLAGIGVKVVGKGYMQLVSFFVNFCQFGLLCVDGGHVTALNSNASFGNYALWSEGYRWLSPDDAPLTVDQTWVTNGSTRTFTTTGGTYVLPGQIPDLVVTLSDAVPARVLLRVVDYTVTKGVTAEGLDCSIITLTKPVAAGLTLTARIRFGSLVEASGYTMSYVGAGLDYSKLSPGQDGQGFADPNKYTIALDNGRIFHTTTDESGDFYVGQVTPSIGYQVSSVRIESGGTGFSNGDTLVFKTAETDSKFLVPVYLTVISTNAGAITSVSITNAGNYLLGTGSFPTNPVAPDTATGANATFEFTWELASARPSFRINQRRGAIDGRSFYQSIFGFMTPFILALSKKGM